MTNHEGDAAVLNAAWTVHKWRQPNGATARRIQQELGDDRSLEDFTEVLEGLVAAGLLDRNVQTWPGNGAPRSFVFYAPSARGQELLPADRVS